MLSFLGPVSYTAGPDPRAVVSADFNNDAVLDFAVANYYSSTVSVLLGNADGTFQPARNSDSDYALSIAVGDFDGDGKLDLVTTGVWDLRVLLGNGDGTFQAPTGSVSFGSVASVAVGDFNADGKLDLGVVSGAGGDYYADPYGYATVLLGNGDGSFSGSSTTELGYGNPGSAALADFNGDGQLDFATTMYGYYGTLYGHIATVKVLLGDALGNLQPPTTFSSGASLGTDISDGP